MTAPAPSSAALARRWRGLAGASRRLVVAGGVSLALVGALLAPGATLLWAPVTGLAAAALAALVGAAVIGGPVSRRAVWSAGAAGVLLVPWTSGLGALGGAGAVVLLAFLMLAAVWAVEVVADAPDTAEGVAARRDLALLRRVAGDLPVAVLLQEWRRTEAHTAADAHPEVRAVGAQIRALIVDELARRDPVGLEHWLHHGDGDPGRYLPGGPPAAP